MRVNKIIRAKIIGLFGVAICVAINTLAIPSVSATTIIFDNDIGESGKLSMYQVKKVNVLLSNYEFDYIYREGQEVRYKADSKEQKLAIGKWSIEDILGSNYDRLIFSFSFPDNYIKASALGFHWAMSCGNDTIEGSAQVPEPASIILLSCAAMGLIRRKRAASSEN